MKIRVKCCFTLIFLLNLLNDVQPTVAKHIHIGGERYHKTVKIEQLFGQESKISGEMNAVPFANLGKVCH